MIANNMLCLVTKFMVLLKSSFARYGSVLKVSTCQVEDLRVSKCCRKVATMIRKSYFIRLKRKISSFI